MIFDTLIQYSAAVAPVAHDQWWSRRDAIKRGGGSDVIICSNGGSDDAIAFARLQLAA